MDGIAGADDIWDSLIIPNGHLFLCDVYTPPKDTYYGQIHRVRRKRSSKCKGFEIASKRGLPCR